MSEPTPTPSTQPDPGNATLALRPTTLRSEAEAETDPARKSRLQHALARFVDIVERNDAGAANEYLAAFQTNRAQRTALIDLVGIYERRKSAVNLARLYQVEAKSARSDAERASALLDLAAVRADLQDDAQGSAAALAEAFGIAPEEPDVALAAELAARLVGDLENLPGILRSRIAACEDAVLRAELVVDLAEALAAGGRMDEALAALTAEGAGGAAGVRIAMALERLARRAGRSDLRASALERLGGLAASALEDAASFEENGIGPLLWEDAIAARAFAVAAYRAAASVHASLEGGDAKVVELCTRAIAIEPSAPWTRLERLASAERIGRDDLVADDEEALSDAVSDGPMGAFILQRLAARLERAGRAADADEAHAEARRLSPASAVVAASVEARVRNRERAEDWLRSLAADDPAAPPERLVEAAFVCDELLDDYGRAHNFYERAIEATARPLPALRALYASALLRGDTATAAAALARMAGLDPASAARCRLERTLGAAIHLDDPSPAAQLARTLLADGASSDVVQLVRSIGALTDDFDLVADAHERLVERTTDPELRAAHRCAAARARIAAGKPDDAERMLLDALSDAEGHSVAVAMLDALLRARGDVDGLARLAERASLGRAGETPETTERVRSAVDAAVLGHASEAAVLARSLLDTLPDAPISARTAAFTAIEIGDAELARIADEALARVEPSELRGFAALRCAERALSRDAHSEAVGHLATALEHPATALEAAMLLALLPDSTRTPELDRRAEQALAAVSGEDASRYFATPGAEAGPAGDDPVLRAARAPSPEIADAQLEMAVDSMAGPAAALAHHVARTVETSDGKDVRDDLGLLVVRAAETPHASDLAVALSDVAFGPHDDLQIPIAALEAAVREAPVAERAALQSRLGRALHAAGRAKEALAPLEAACAANRDDVAALECLRIAARDAGEHELFVDACDRLAERAEGATRAELLEDASAVLERLGRPREALERARRALSLEPSRDRAYHTVRALLTALRDDAGLAELAAARAQTSGDTATRVRQLFEAARLRRSGGDREGTLTTIQSLLALDPRHAGALAMRAELAVAMEAFEDAVAALRALALADVPPAQKRVARMGAADFLERKLGRPREALAELRAIDALGVADAAVLQRMARLAEADDAFAEAQALHERVAGSDAPAARRAESERCAANLRWKFGRDEAGAAAGYRRALALVPDDVESATSLLRLVQDDAERLEIARSVDAAVRATLVPEGLKIESLRKLLRIADLRGARDLMKLVLSTLSVLRIATDDERAREEENTAIVRRVRPPTHPIAEALARLHAPDDRAPYSEIAAQLFDVLVDHDALQLSRLGANKSEPLPRTDGLRAELVDLASAFGIAEAEAFVSPQLDPRRIVAVPTERGIHFVVPKNAAVPMDPWLRFHAGRLTWAVAQKTLPFVQRTPEEGAAILLGALDACQVPIGDLRARPGVADWSTVIARGIGRKNKKAVHDLGAALLDRGAGAENFCRAARQSANRAGLLVSSDLDAALANVLGATPSFERVAQTNEAADLVCFHLSSTSLTLRRELGLAS